MRGTLFHCHGDTVRRGIIPAYAGNTIASAPFVSPARDHPRICGEHRRMYVSIVVFGGSSPHMRGTLIVFQHTPRNGGIIPAYAGNTGGEMAIMATPGDHPRICGEH